LYFHYFLDIEELMVYKYKQLIKVFEVFGALLLSLSLSCPLYITPSLSPCINDERGNKFWLYPVAKVNEQELHAYKKK